MVLFCCRGDVGGEHREKSAINQTWQTHKITDNGQNGTRGHWACISNAQSESIRRGDKRRRCGGPLAAPPTHLRVNGVQRALIADAALGNKRYPRADIRHTGGRHNGRPEVKALRPPRARPTVVAAVLTRQHGHDAIASALRTTRWEQSTNSGPVWTTNTFAAAQKRIPIHAARQCEPIHRNCRC